jgi:proteasome lid subunit RPN8/RPN11
VKRLELPRLAFDTINAAAHEGYPYEICGVLAGHRYGDSARVTRAVAFPNTAEEAQRRRRFAIDPLSIMRLERELRKTGESLLGFYHSHPDHPAQPSVTDMEYFRLWPQTVWLIMPVAKGEPGVARGWWLESAEADGAVEIEVQTVQKV